jgi:hypothetical protein
LSESASNEPTTRIEWIKILHGFGLGQVRRVGERTVVWLDHLNDYSS